METIKAFFADYGYSFLMMVVIGFVIALITEITVKKAIAWLEEKFEGHERLLALVRIAKIVAIQFATWVMVIAFTKLLVENMPLPANKVFYPVWIFLVYVIQFLFSCWGIKGVQNLIAKKAEKALEPKPEKPAKKDPVEGMIKLSDNLYTDGQNHYFNRKGKQL